MSIKRNIKKGEVIFNEGNFSDCAYIIEKGKVEILEGMADGRKRTLGILKAQDMFGEMGLIDGMPRSATARALEDSVVHVLTRETFDSLLKSNPEALMPILKVLSVRLRETLDLLKGGFKVPGVDRRNVSPIPVNHSSMS